MTELSRYFNDSELSCRCCGTRVDVKEFDDRLLELRLAFGEPMRVNCAYRCPKHNEEVGGADNSYHLKGLAIDIHSPDPGYRTRLFISAVNLGWSVGVYKSFLHLDIRDTQVIFRGGY